MFFIISKILGIVTKPILWGMLLLCIGIWKKHKRFLCASFLVFYVFGNSFLIDEILRVWEHPITEKQWKYPFEVGVVLGGFSTYNAKDERIEFKESSDRFIQGIRLKQENKIRYLVISGGSGSLTDKNLEADYSGAFALQLGVDSRELILENTSKNTRENLLFTKQILSEREISGKILLITSATHMRRSLGIAKKLQMEVYPFPVDYLSGNRKWYFDHLFIPNTDAYFQWEVLLHEWIGVMVYKVMGYM